MSRNQFLLRLLLNADGDLDSIHILAKIPLSLPLPCVWVQTAIWVQSSIFRRGGADTGAKTADTPPHSVPQSLSQSQARLGDADQSELRSLRHADPWNNFTLLTPAPATPPSPSPTANSPLDTRILNLDKIFRVGVAKHQYHQVQQADGWGTKPTRAL